MGRLAHRPRFGIRGVGRFGACFGVAIGVVLAGSGRAAVGDGDGPRCVIAEGPVAVVAVDDAGDLVIEDGRVLHLAGIEVPEGYEAAARRRLDGLAGRSILFSVVSGRDRWGRIAVLVRPLALDAAEAPPPRLDVALIAAGEARRLAGADVPEACLGEAVQAEAQARAAHLGLWAHEDNRPPDAEDTAVLLGRVGRFTVFEGRVFSVGVRAERTYINFGRRWSDDTTVTIPKRIWRKVEARGMSAEALRGRRVRVRGIVENRGGPYVEVSAPDEIEFIETDQAR